MATLCPIGVWSHERSRELHSDGITVPLGLEGLTVEGEEIDPTGGIRAVVVVSTQRAWCVGCGHETAKEHDRRSRLLADLPLGEHRVTLEVRRRRFRCLHCDRVFTEEDEVGGKRRRLSERLRRKLCEEGRMHSVELVARRYQVSPTTVRRAIAEFGAQPIAAQNTPLKLGIDEFSVRKGQRYATALHDLGTHRVIDVVLGRKSRDVQVMIERIRDKEAVRVVSMDMSLAFREAVQLTLPEAAIVADKFHVVARVNEALRECCQDLTRGEPRDRAWRKQTRLLLRRVEKLTPDERDLILPILKAYPLLRRAWLLKEDFRRWYRDTHSPTEAISQYGAWRRELDSQAQLPAFQKLRPMLDQWQEPILNYFTWRVTQGPVEGANNRIKTIERQAYGYRNFENLRTRILNTA